MQHFSAKLHVKDKLTCWTFKSKMDLDVYHEGRNPVLEGENRFDLKPETLGQFLKLLDRKATDQG